MSTALDLASLAAQGELKIPIARGVVSQGGSGTDYTGWSGVSSVFVEAKVELREQSRGFATLTLTVEGSADGSSWSTLQTFTFGHGGSQSATVSSPPAHLRVSWAVGGHSEWQIIEVTAAPSIIDTGGGGGGSQSETVTVTTDPNTFTVEHVFDFAGPVTAFVTLTITAIVLDGETFAADGVRPLWEDSGGNSAVISPDGVDYTSADSSGALYHAGKGNAGGSAAAFQVGDVGYQGWSTPRYLKVPVTIFDADGATVYNGPHHPTVTVRLDVVYV